MRANWPIRHDGVTYDTGADVSHLSPAVLARLAIAGAVTLPPAPEPASEPVPAANPAPAVTPAKKKAAHA